MSTIRYIDDQNGNHVFPVTHERAVRDSDGVTLETKLGQKQDTIPDLSTIRSGAAAGATAVQPAALDAKQDTIADLPDIRSGAALGSTSVQPADIEDMVEAEPIGSIIPPVNPSEFATTEEVSQLGQEVDEKIDRELADDTLYITDASRNIIAQIDADGVSTIDVKVKIDGELVSVKSLLSTLSGSVATEQARAETEEAKKLDHTLADNKFIITDADGNIIVKVDKDGIHSAMSKHAVACMVFGEYYYPTSAPTRDENGNVTHAEVMFGTGVAGSVDITYSGVNAVQVLAHYGDYTYTITIQRDENGNVEVVSVN